jgi:23S rRNA pseudouridine1911/1915/1917 synthase
LNGWWVFDKIMIMIGKDLKILYEDNHLIAAFKPSGVLVQGDASEDVSLMDLVKDYIRHKYKKQGNVFLGLMHRLDRPVAGVVLFAKTSKGASRLSEQIRNREFKKTYMAIVEGELRPNKGTLINKLVKDENKKIALSSEAGDESVLDYETVALGGERSLVKINLITGRFHQIRAQLSLAGHPIIGDIKYGARKALSNKNILLCATEIKFKTATGEESKSIEINYPKEWDRYLK